MRIPQVRLRYCLESLLAGGVPELQFYNVIIYFDLFDFEINSNSAILQRIEVVLGKPQQHGRLAAARVAQHDHLVQCRNLVGLYFFGVEAYAFAQVGISLRFLVYYMARDESILTNVRLLIVKILELILMIVKIVDAFIGEAIDIAIVQVLNATFLLRWRSLFQV